MKVIGKINVGATFVEAAANRMYVTRRVTATAIRIVKLTAYVDGLGSGVGDQVMRAVIYDGSGNLLAQGDEVLVRDGAAAAWVDLMLSKYPGGISFAAGSAHDLGIHVGGPGTNSIRLWGDLT